MGLSGILVPYGSLTLTESSPPQSFVEPLTVADIVSYLRLPDSMASVPAVVEELTAFIVSAREQAEIAQGRDLVVKQWDQAHDYWPSYRVELRPPLRSVDLVQYRDSDGNYTEMVVDQDYVVDASKQPAVLAPPYAKNCWPTFTPWPSSAILIRYTSGFALDATWWSDAGSRVKVGMKALVKSWFQRQALSTTEREGIDNLLSQGRVPRAK